MHPTPRRQNTLPRPLPCTVPELAQCNLDNACHDQEEREVQEERVQIARV
jgi:hypothetical protein